MIYNTLPLAITVAIIGLCHRNEYTLVDGQRYDLRVVTPDYAVFTNKKGDVKYILELSVPYGKFVATSAELLQKIDSQHVVFQGRIEFMNVDKAILKAFMIVFDYRIADTPNYLGSLPLNTMDDLDRHIAITEQMEVMKNLPHKFEVLWKDLNSSLMEGSNRKETAATIFHLLERIYPKSMAKELVEN